MSITFNEAVSGFVLADLQLMRNGTAVPLTGATLTTTDNITWMLGNLTSLTGLPNSVDTYTLTLVAAGSGIVDGNNNAIISDASTSFTVLDPAVFQCKDHPDRAGDRRQRHLQLHCWFARAGQPEWHQLQLRPHRDHHDPFRQQRRSGPGHSDGRRR